MSTFKSVRRISVGIMVAALLSVDAATAARTSGGLPDFTGLVERYSPAVVNISTTAKREVLRTPLQIPDIPKDNPLHDFFRRFLGEGEMEERDSRSLGSGFIISKDGYVITNNHVVKESDEVIVRLSDRRELTAELVGADERSDIALLKINATDLPTVKIRTDVDVKVGEWVFAIGSPFEFDHSVTAGIVSAKGRALPSENYVPFIQTDVAINPGNSGGPLFNLDGNVVGVNSQIYSRTGGFMGLSFAIPIDVAMDVAHQLRDKGKVSRGWLGVLIQDVTRDLAESFGMDKPEGAAVLKVLPDSPAERAGFQVRDIVLEFNGQRVDHSSDLPPIVGRTKVGKRIPVKVLRDGKSQTLHVVIAELPEEEELKLAAGRGPKSVSANKLGVVVNDLSAEQREELEVETHGVVVNRVEDGPAKQAGIRTGDVILMLGGVKVENAAHFQRLAAEMPAGKAISTLVQRGGNPVFFALKTPK